MAHDYAKLKCLSKGFRTSDNSFVCVQVCTAKMNLSDEVDLEDYVSRPDKISAAEVGALKLSWHLSPCL